MQDHIRKGVVKVALSEDADCEMLAAYDSAVARRLAVQSRNGASREKLLPHAMRA